MLEIIQQLENKVSDSHNQSERSRVSIENEKIKLIEIIQKDKHKILQLEQVNSHTTETIRNT